MLLNILRKRFNNATSLRNFSQEIEKFINKNNKDSRNKTTVDLKQLFKESPTPYFGALISKEIIPTSNTQRKKTEISQKKQNVPQRTYLQEIVREPWNQRKRKNQRSVILEKKDQKGIKYKNRSILSQSSAFRKKKEDRIQNGKNLTSLFVHLLTKNGKGTLAEKQLWQSFKRLKLLKKENPRWLLWKFLMQTRPHLKMYQNQVAVRGKKFIFPIELSFAQQILHGIHNWRQALNGRSEKSLIEKIAQEIFEGAQNKGRAKQQTDELHRKAVEYPAPFAMSRW